MNVTAQARSAGRRADQSDLMDHAVRVGIVSYGVVHLVLAWLTLKLVLGGGGGSASNQGALSELAESTLGRISLYVAAAGFLALVVWQAMEALAGHRGEEGAKRAFKRVVSVAKVVIYGSLALTAFKTASGGSSGGGGTDGITTKLMQQPAGPLLVGAVGMVIVGVGGFLVHRGWKEKFRSKLELEGQTGNDGKAYLWLGKAGYLSKGVAIAVVGLLFLYAALTNDPDKSGGLDVALHKVLQQPFGGPMLFLIAAGFACYGLFCFAWARHLDR